MTGPVWLGPYDRARKAGPVRRTSKYLALNKMPNIKNIMYQSFKYVKIKLF